MNSLVSYKVGQLAEADIAPIVLTGKMLQFIVDSCVLLEARELCEILVTLATGIWSIILVRPLMLFECSLAIKDLFATILFANEEHFCFKYKAKNNYS